MSSGPSLIDDQHVGLLALTITNQQGKESPMKFLTSIAAVALTVGSAATFAAPLEPRVQEV